MAAEQPESRNKESEPVGEETTDSLFIKRRYCCCIPMYSSHRSSSTVGLTSWERIRTVGNEERWWGKGVRALMKFREWSELAAGPRWKTFIRRFNRTRSGGGSGSGSGSGGRHHHLHGKFQYDALSYSLNFDEGPGQNGLLSDGDDYGGLRDFSARYAAVSVPVRT